ncbi:MAG: hypothetical protein HOC94_05370 [Waddliaceae bacterium]|nr:hypothetical protein [Waddliaceae bacterium]
MSFDIFNQRLDRGARLRVAKDAFVITTKPLKWWHRIVRFFRKQDPVLLAVRNKVEEALENRPLSTPDLEYNVTILNNRIKNHNDNNKNSKWLSWGRRKDIARITTANLGKPAEQPSPSVPPTTPPPSKPPPKASVLHKPAPKSTPKPAPKAPKSKKTTRSSRSSKLVELAPGHKGIKNLGITCYLNSFLQRLARNRDYDELLNNPLKKRETTYYDFYGNKIEEEETEKAYQARENVRKKFLHIVNILRSPDGKRQVLEQDIKDLAKDVEATGHWQGGRGLIEQQHDQEELSKVILGEILGDDKTAAIGLSRQEEYLSKGGQNIKLEVPKVEVTKEREIELESSGKFLGAIRTTLLTLDRYDVRFLVGQDGEPIIGVGISDMDAVLAEQLIGRTDYNERLEDHRKNPLREARQSDGRLDLKPLHEKIFKEKGLIDSQGNRVEGKFREEEKQRIQLEIEGSIGGLYRKIAERIASDKGIDYPRSFKEYDAEKLKQEPDHKKDRKKPCAQQLFQKLGLNEDILFQEARFKDIVDRINFLKNLDMNNVSVIGADKHVSKHLVDHPIFPDKLVINYNPVFGQIRDIPPKFKIKDLFPDYKGGNSEDEYELVDFVHYSGSGSGGHYTYYHKDDDGQWRVYDDSSSSTVTERAVLSKAASNGRSFMFRKVSASVE